MGRDDDGNRGHDGLDVRFSAFAIKKGPRGQLRAAGLFTNHREHRTRSVAANCNPETVHFGRESVG